MQQYTSANTAQLLDKSGVIWKPHYTLDRASLGQIMKTFERIKITPKNNYERVLADELKKIITQLINSFDQLLHFATYTEAQVYYYNLLGPLPENVRVNTEEHKTIRLKTANVGNLLKATYQRVNFILEREVPLMYKYNPDYLSAFNTMRSNLQKFLPRIQQFEEGFVDAVDKAHKSKSYMDP